MMDPMTIDLDDAADSEASDDISSASHARRMFAASEMRVGQMIQQEVERQLRFHCQISVSEERIDRGRGQRQGAEGGGREGRGRGN
jgi:hypothetical protein